MIERTLVNRIQRWCHTREIYCRKIHGDAFQHRGMADLLIVVEGRALFLECKTQGGQLSESQKAERLNVRRAGSIYIVCRTIGQATEAITFLMPTILGILPRYP